MALAVFAGIGKLFALLNILERNQTFKVAVIIGNEQLFNFVRKQYFFSVAQINILTGRNEVVAGHDVCNLRIKFRFNPKVPVCYNAFQFQIGIIRRCGSCNNRDAGNGVTEHQVKRILHGCIFVEGKGVADNAAFIPFNPCNFPGLPFNRKVLVDNADTSCTSQRNGKSRFCDGIHCRAYQWYFQCNGFGQPAISGCFFRENT